MAVSINGGTAVTLEPGASTERAFGLKRGQSATESVQAWLAADPSVSATTQCKVTAGKTTNVTITSSIASGGKVVLAITAR